jgi:hypothetical protein
MRYRRTYAALAIVVALAVWAPCSSAWIYAGEEAPGLIVGYEGAMGTVVNPDTPIPEVNGLTIDEFGRLLIATSGDLGEVLLFDIEAQTIQVLEYDVSHYATEDVYPDPADSNIYIIKNGRPHDSGTRCDSYLGILEGGVGPAGVIEFFGSDDTLIDLQVWPMGERAGNILILVDSGGPTYGFLAEFEKLGPGMFTRLPDIVAPGAMVPEPGGFAITPGGDIVIVDQLAGLHHVAGGAVVPFGDAAGPCFRDMEIGSDGTIYLVNTESDAIERYDEYGTRILPDLTGGITSPTAVTAASFVPTPEGPYVFVEPLSGVEITYEEVTNAGFTSAVAESSENRVSPAGNFLPDCAVLPGGRADKFIYIGLATDAVYRSLIQVDVLMEGSRLFYASGVGDTFRDFTVVGTIDDARGTMPRFDELGSPFGRRLETGPTEVVLVDDTRPLTDVTLYKFWRLGVALDLDAAPSQNSCPWEVVKFLNEFRLRARTRYDEGALWLALSELAVMNSILREHAGWCVPDMSDDPDFGNLVGKILAHSKTLMYSIELENGEAFTGIGYGSTRVSLAVASSPGEECSLALSGPPGTELSARIYDVAGRLVATVFDGRLPEGGVTVTWYGLDETGARTASGVYFALVEHAGVSQMAKVVHVK